MCAFIIKQYCCSADMENKVSVQVYSKFSILFKNRKTSHICEQNKFGITGQVVKIITGKDWGRKLITNINI